jgi:uncharacterized protein (DUF2384 family)
MFDNYDEIYDKVFDFLKDEAKTKLWFNTPNPNFGNTKPIDLILKGRSDKVLLVVDALLKGY